MRSRLPLAAGVALLLLGTPATGGEIAQVSLGVRAEFAVRTSLQVSSELLRFELTDAGADATATIHFRTAARMPSDAEVVLSVEQTGAPSGPGGAANADAVISVLDEDNGGLAAAVQPGQRTVIGRWHGSGLHQGRLCFTLHARAAGSYTIPVRFLLTTP